MKIIGINGSPRVGDSTAQMVQVALEAALDIDPGIDVKRIDLADYRIHGCIDCSGCTDYGRCGINDDFNRLLPILTDPELGAVLIASPAHLGSPTAQCKAFLDRTQLMQRNGGAWRGKAGGAIAIGAGEGGGQELTVQCLHAAMLYHDMVLVQAGGTEDQRLDGPLSCRGGQPSEACLQAARRLGRRLAETALKLFA
jgi:multimeric flavodoxin WrbA